MWAYSPQASCLVARNTPGRTGNPPARNNPHLCVLGSNSVVRRSWKVLPVPRGPRFQGLGFSAISPPFVLIRRRALALGSRGNRLFSANRPDFVGTRTADTRDGRSSFCGTSDARVGRLLSASPDTVAIYSTKMQTQPTSECMDTDVADAVELEAAYNRRLRVFRPAEDSPAATQ